MDSIMHFPPSPSHLFHLRPKYCPWFPLLEQPQPKTQCITLTFMLYVVYIKFCANFHFDTFWHPLMPPSGSLFPLYFLLSTSEW
jgi:hypothetical protein